jgi:hypothetical protein
MLSPDQVDYLSSLHFISQIDRSLKAVSSVKIVDAGHGQPQRVLLRLELFFQDDAVDTLSFDLHHYTYDEIIELARDIKSNEFILREIDQYLAGDMAE